MPDDIRPLPQSLPFASSLNERVAELLRIARYRRATNKAELSEIQRIRYNCYLQEGIIDRNTEQSMHDEFDKKENTYNFSMHIGDDIVSAIRIHVVNSIHPYSPSMSSFEDVLMPFVREGKTLIDPTRFVVDADASRKYPGLAHATLRIPFLASEYFNSDIALASVRSEHMPFYRKTLRYTASCEPRPYLQLTKPLGLMIANFNLEKGSVIKKYPFFDPHLTEMEILFGCRPP